MDYINLTVKALLHSWNHPFLIHLTVDYTSMNERNMTMIMENNVAWTENNGIPFQTETTIQFAPKTKINKGGGSLEGRKIVQLLPEGSVHRKCVKKMAERWRGWPRHDIVGFYQYWGPNYGQVVSHVSLCLVPSRHRTKMHNFSPSLFIAYPRDQILIYTPSVPE